MLQFRIAVLRRYYGALIKINLLVSKYKALKFCKGIFKKLTTYIKNHKENI